MLQTKQNIITVPTPGPRWGKVVIMFRMLQTIEIMQAQQKLIVPATGLLKMWFVIMSLTILPLCHNVPILPLVIMYLPELIVIAFMLIPLS